MLISVATVVLSCAFILSPPLSVVLLSSYLSLWLLELLGSKRKTTNKSEKVSYQQWILSTCWLSELFTSALLQLTRRESLPQHNCSLFPRLVPTGTSNAGRITEHTHTVYTALGMWAGCSLKLWELTDTTLRLHNPTFKHQLLFVNCRLQCGVRWTKTSSEETESMSWPRSSCLMSLLACDVVNWLTMSSAVWL